MRYQGASKRVENPACISILKEGRRERDQCRIWGSISGYRKVCCHIKLTGPSSTHYHSGTESVIVSMGI